MKRFLLFFALLPIFQGTYADPIDIERASKIAERFAATDSNLSLVKKGEHSDSVSVILPFSNNDISPYYIFSRGEGKGYVIVSGDDCLPEILGYTDSGDFVEEEMPVQLLEWLDYYSSLIEYAQIHKAKPRNASIRPFANRTDVPKLLKTRWHQSSPYNLICPIITGTEKRAITGCVATAAAMVVHYFHKDNPDTLMAATPTYNYGKAPVTMSLPQGTPLKWDLMLNSYNSSVPQEMRMAVATLMYSVGTGAGLGYGHSTGGHIYNLVKPFSNFYNLSSSHRYKGGSQAEWENIIYQNLIEGRPIVYSGYKDGTGGHAIVLDGYEASTNLFHFNFGWGGQGDGYYTVDDQTGVNGFKSYQQMLCNVEPKKQNLKGSLVIPDKIYAYRNNSISINIINDGTLAYKGLYLFVNSKCVLPSNITDAVAKDIDFSIPPDGMRYSFNKNIKLNNFGKHYIFLTDKNKNIIYTDSFDVETPISDISFVSIDVSGSTEKTIINENEYKVVYNTRTTGLVTLRNKGTSVYEGRPRLSVYASHDDGHTFSYVGYKSAEVKIPAGGETTVEFNISDASSCPIDTGIPYKVFLERTIRTIDETVNISFNTEDTLSTFILRKSDLKVDKYEGRILYFSGHWDHIKFKTLIGSTRYSDAAGYDLRGVEGIGTSLPNVRHNVLYYVDDTSGICGENVVKVGSETSVCNSLKLHPGYDFVPLMDFTAVKAEFSMESLSINKWELVYLPFSAEVPSGVMAKKIMSHASMTGIYNRTEDIRHIEAGTPVLVMRSSGRQISLSSENVHVSVFAENQGDTCFVGSYVNIPVPDGGYVLDYYSNDQYFIEAQPGTKVSAFGGFFIDPAVTRKFKANSSITYDPVYAVLGNSISACDSFLISMESSLTDEAIRILEDSISAAEKIFSERPFSSTADVKEYSDGLDELCRLARFRVCEGVEICVDCTDLIINPSFEDRTTNGWSVDAMSFVKQNSSLDYYGVGCDGSYLLYNIDTSDSTGTSISQILTGLPEGYYRLSARIGTDTGYSIELYGGDQTVAVPGHKFGQFYMTESVVDSIHVDQEGILEIGVRRASRWYKADCFKLSYLGLGGSTPTSIPEFLQDDDNVSGISAIGGPGYVDVSVSTPRTVTLYTLSGMVVSTARVEKHYRFENVRKGFYIVDGCKLLVF